MSFEDKIKEWVATDNRIKNNAVERKKLRNHRTELTHTILDYVTAHDMTHNTIQISDGLIKFQNVKMTPPLTFKFITQCLKDCMENEEQVNQLVNYIKEKREIRYIPEVKRTYKSV